MYVHGYSGIAIGCSLGGCVGMASANRDYSLLALVMKRGWIMGRQMIITFGQYNILSIHYTTMDGMMMMSLSQPSLFWLLSSRF
jgi:hypothetical protein